MMEQKRRNRRFGWILGGLALAVLWHGASFATPFLRVVRAARPIALSLGLAFVLGILLCALERLWGRLFGARAPRARRAVCLCLTLLLALGLPILLGSLLLPTLRESLVTLIDRLPIYRDSLQAGWDRLSAWLAERSIALPPSLPSTDAIGERLSDYLQENGGALWRLSLDFLRSVGSAVWIFAVALVLTTYLLAQKERHVAAVRRLLCSTVSDDTERRLRHLWYTVREVFTRFVVGQAFEALVLGGLCFLGMLVFGFPYAALISLLIGISALIPIFGALIGTGAGALLIFLEEPSDALWFVLFILVLQQIEGNLIYPRVVGRSVGLPALWVLCAVTVGGAFGLVGMLLAVPTASVAYRLLRERVEAAEQREK